MRPAVPLYCAATPADGCLITNRCSSSTNTAAGSPSARRRRPQVVPDRAAVPRHPAQKSCIRPGTVAREAPPVASRLAPHGASSAQVRHGAPARLDRPNRGASRGRQARRARAHPRLRSSQSAGTPPELNGEPYQPPAVVHHARGVAGRWPTTCGRAVRRRPGLGLRGAIRPGSPTTATAACATLHPHREVLGRGWRRAVDERRGTARNAPGELLRSRRRPVHGASFTPEEARGGVRRCRVL